MADLTYPDSMIEGSQNSQGVHHDPIKTFTGSHRVLLLHGNLDIFVKEAKNLPNMDLVNNNIGDMIGSLSGKLQTSDPYVTIVISGAVIGRTFVIKDNENPVWDQHFHVPVAHYGTEVQFVVKDNDIVGSEIMGVVGIPVEHVIFGKRISGTYPILGLDGKPCNRKAVLSLSVEYTPVEKVQLYHCGVGSDHSNKGVPRTYFPLKRGGTVTLYQDAHVHDGSLPNVVLGNGTIYKNAHCWRDIYDAISQARWLVYITGWSVYHLVQLVRDDPQVTDSRLGDLLKVKSQEGVRVLLLVWDDPTSTTILGYKTEGVMNTGDDETRRYFKHSCVKVLLCPRTAGKSSWAKKQETETIYTHHQKSVIVDAACGNRRKIVAFVGGLDLCRGRYDTPEHPIFSTLQTIHRDDYHNPNFMGPTEGCPREPWHDLHCRFDGQAACDVLRNFEERWLKASKRRGHKAFFDDSLLKIKRIPEIMGFEESATVTDGDPEAWNIQVFRSIDSNSVRGFPKDLKKAYEMNLVCGKNVLIDMSIHTAYVKAIRAAEHFIYIENQYFLGSSYNWTNHKNLGANNLIPMEIALKIAKKIRAKERFAVYIVIPMWPEGAPTSKPTQRILYWQYNTMQMMYETIYNALADVGLDSEQEPQDYLNFFCLGKREPDYSGNESPSTAKSPRPHTPRALTQKHQRFMIYVHSKGMIVDDEYVLLGSANINQRSLEGTRDTEIAMGAYQPLYTWDSQHANPKGQIYGYRMSLWAEHTGTLEPCFENPESLECVRRVRWMGQLNWQQFESDEISPMIGHLLKYPVHVDSIGNVRPLPGCEAFPDMGGKIIGTFSGIQENLTI